MRNSLEKVLNKNYQLKTRPQFSELQQNASEIQSIYEEIAMASRNVEVHSVSYGNTMRLIVYIDAKIIQIQVKVDLKRLLWELAII